MNLTKILPVLLCCLFVQAADGQLIGTDAAQANKLAVPFLLISQDATSSGMADAGSALRSGITSVESNIAKGSFLEERSGINLTYTPWLRKLISDRKLMYIGGFYKISPKVVLSASLSYLSYGQIDLIDNNQVSFGSMKPTEYVVGLGVSKSFGSQFSLGMKLKIIHSNLYGGTGDLVFTQSGTAYAIDLSSYHIFPINALSLDSHLALAVNVENIGPKISYFNRSDQKSSLPTNLKIGTAFNTSTSAGDEFSLAMDFNKLLVPDFSSSPDQSVMEGMIASFDPHYGAGFGDIGISLGAQYNFKKKIAFRAGYNFQGNERTTGDFFSVGMGVKHKKLNLNVAYLTGNPQRTFLSNTLRLGLGYLMP